jgi:hypothetical protein
MLLVKGNNKKQKNNRQRNGSSFYRIFLKEFLVIKDKFLALIVLV